MVVQNLCLKASQACKGQRVFTAPRIGVAEDKVAQYAGLHYYTDKELQVISHINYNFMLSNTGFNLASNRSNASNIEVLFEIGYAKKDALLTSAY